jgi:hypothetical protein
VRLAVLLVRDVATAEDVVQDSFVAMHDGWQRLRDAESALAYLRQAGAEPVPVGAAAPGRGGKVPGEAVTGHAQCRALARWCSWNGPR